MMLYIINVIKNDVSKSVVLKFIVHQNHLEGLLRQFLTQEIWVRAREFTFLTSSQMLLLMLRLGPRCANHSQPSH